MKRFTMEDRRGPLGRLLWSHVDRLTWIPACIWRRFLWWAVPPMTLRVDFLLAYIRAGKKGNFGKGLLNDLYDYFLIDQPYVTFVPKDGSEN